MLKRLLAVLIACVITSGLALPHNKHDKNKKVLRPGSCGFTHAVHQSPPQSKKRYARHSRLFSTFSTFNQHNPLQPSFHSQCPRDPICTFEDQKYRTFDGSCNNLENPSFGQSGLPFIRLVPKDPTIRECGKGSQFPNARSVSSLTFNRGEMGTQPDITMMLMIWGQILDHDIELTPPRETADGDFLDCCAQENMRSPQCCPLFTPNDDSFYGKQGRPRCMPFLRSKIAQPGGCKGLEEADVENSNTPWIDGSFLYGSDLERANELRTFQGGLLKTTEDKRKRSFPVITFEDGMKMQFGDNRGDVQPGATMISTAFLRNHNKLARELSRMHPDWHDEKLFQEARKINVALIQHITYTEFIDKLLGTPNNVGLTDRKGVHINFYNPMLNGAISMGFGTAGYRLHTYVGGFFDLRDQNYLKHKTLQLRDIFHNPTITVKDNTYDDIMRGLCAQPLHRFDNVITEEMTEWLFREKDDNWGLDIAALNVQRGRDHQLPGYPTYKEFCGYGKVNNWKDMTDLIPGELVHRLVHTYNSPRNVDLYVAGNMEPALDNSILGPTFHCLVREQFERLKNADRFFYTNPGQFTHQQLATIGQQTLSRILCDNADNPHEMRLTKNVFRMMNRHNNPLVSCSNLMQLPPLNINAWR